jgi:hypothetical protein
MTMNITYNVKHNDLPLSKQPLLSCIHILVILDIKGINYEKWAKQNQVKLNHNLLQITIFVRQCSYYIIFTLTLHIYIA